MNQDSKKHKERTEYTNGLVPSVNDCNRLLANGWDERTVFGWRNYKGTTRGGVSYNDWELQDFDSRYCIVAPTLQEIMENLPRIIKIDDKMLEQPSITRDCDGYYTASYKAANGRRYLSTGGSFPAVRAAVELWIVVAESRAG